MSIRGEVLYMPAETSVFRSRSSLMSFSRSVRKTPDARGGRVDEAARAGGRLEVDAAPAKP